MSSVCPGCGVVSSRVYSLYTRHPDDLPVSGCRVWLELRVRKFFCDNPGCSRSVFCERLPQVLASHARRTERLQQVLMHLALLVSARTARRAGCRLGLPGSASTFLRLAHSFEPMPATATAVGIDDFAFRRGSRYGTLVIDLATRRPLEVLPDWSFELVRDYLMQHPEIRLIGRDRDARYAEAAERHLGRRRASLSEALREHARGETGSIALQTAALTEPAPLVTRLHPVSPLMRLRQEQGRQRRRELFDRVHELHRAGRSKTQIASELGINRQTVATYLSRDAPPDYSSRERTPSLVDPFAEYLARRWAEGCENASLLKREITALGYSGSNRAVRQYVRPWHEATPSATPSRAPPALPAPRALAWLVLREPGQLSTAETAILTALLAACPEFAGEAKLLRGGFNALRHRNLSEWRTWTAQVEQSDSIDLKRFTRDLEWDDTALSNALSMPFSNGPTEGHVNRVKLIKRSMYGRAGFELLCKKIVYQAS